MRSAIVNLRGTLASAAGFPLLVPPVTLHQGGADGPVVDLTGKSARFVLETKAGVRLLALTVGSGLQIDALAGRVLGSSNGISHPPIPAGVHIYTLTVCEPDGMPFAVIRGEMEFLPVPQ